MPNTTITRYGLDFASSASPEGTLIAPLYFVPVYDHRLDSLIHDGSNPVSAFSACVNVSATSPYGEIIWNTDDVDYTLSDVNLSYLISAGDAVSAEPYQIQNPVQSQKWQVNLKAGVPLMDHWVGLSSDYDGSDWNVSDDTALVTGVNSADSGTAKFFPVTDYYPVSADTPDSHTRGRIKCRLAKNIGTAKFNKIALYIIQRDDEGNISPTEPVFFSETMLKTALVKTSMGANGIDDITVDIDIDLHSLSANWAEVFFSTSGDYWSRVPGGVYYPEKVGIGQFDSETDEPQATLHVKPPRSQPGARLNKFQREETYLSDDIAENLAETVLSNEDTSQGTGTIMEIYEDGSGALYPLIADEMDLGKDTQRFRDGFFSHDIEAGHDISAGHDMMTTNDMWVGRNLTVEETILAYSTIRSTTLILSDIDVSAGHNVLAANDIIAIRNIQAGRDILAFRDIYAMQNMSADGAGHFGGSLSADGNLDIGGYGVFGGGAAFGGDVLAPNLEASATDFQNQIDGLSASILSTGEFSAALSSSWWLTNHTIIIKYTKIGDVVMLHLPTFSATAAGSGCDTMEMIVSGGPIHMPDSLRPITDKYAPVVLYDSYYIASTALGDISGRVKIPAISSGNTFVFAIDVGPGFDEGGFSTNPNSKGFMAQTITYNLT